jgi:hypothetical protein
MNTPEILEIRDLFNASDNATAVTRVRYYLDQLDRSVKRCAECPSGVCSLCVERRRFVDDVRALLPDVTS